MTPVYYDVDEISYTLQGEGLRVGEPSVFIRFAGCNLRCSWCDQPGSLTKRGSERMTALEILRSVKTLFGDDGSSPTSWLVLTGGEPLTRDLSNFLDMAHMRGHLVAVETNGTIFHDWVPCLDHICVSPKNVEGGSIDPAFYAFANEFKFIVDSSKSLAFIDRYAADIPSHTPIFLQPEWTKQAECLPLCIKAVLDRGSRFRLSLQVHKLAGVP